MSSTAEITKGLFKKFKAHKYMMSNSFVYKWESDFFSQLSSGYHQEIEVKVSRSDFFADFKKEDKHRVLEQKFAGHKTVTYRRGPYYKVVYDQMKYVLDERGRRKIGPDGKRVMERSGKVNTMTTMSEKTRGEISRELSHSWVDYIDAHCPNRFWYLCPKDLISAEEVPDYAGLMYYDNGKYIKIKAAPLIHKEKRNLASILLDKFYYKYLYSKL